jgi:hypothetical protein
MKKFAGFGADGEKVSIEIANPLQILVHCEGNRESPFEFSELSGAKEFIRMIGVTGIIEQFPCLGEMDPEDCN